MLTCAIVTFAAALAVAQTPTPSKEQPAASKPADPATSSFATDAGLILVVIKPDKTADFELAIRTLQEKLSAPSEFDIHWAPEG